MTEDDRRMIRIRILHLLKNAELSPRELREMYRKTYLQYFSTKKDMREFWGAVAYLIGEGDILLFDRSSEFKKKVYAITNKGYNSVTPRQRRKKIENGNAKSPFRKMFRFLFR